MDTISSIIGIVLPIVIVAAFIIFIITKKARPESLLMTPTITNRRFDWITGATMSGLWTIFTIALWNAPPDTVAPFFQTGNTTKDAFVMTGILVSTFLFTFMYHKKNRMMVILSMGITPRDERETLIVLRAQQLAFFSLAMCLIATYILILFTTMPSKSAFIFLIILIMTISRTVFDYTLDRQSRSAGK